jgi:ubiquinone biosynthesis protein UbiJ
MCSLELRAKPLNKLGKNKDFGQITNFNRLKVKSDSNILIELTNIQNSYVLNKFTK